MEHSSLDPFVPKASLYRCHSGTFEIHLHLPGVVTNVEIIPHLEHFTVSGVLVPRRPNLKAGNTTDKPAATLLWTDQACGVFSRDISLDLSPGTEYIVQDQRQDCDKYVVKYSIRNKVKGVSHVACAAQRPSTAHQDHCTTEILQTTTSIQEGHHGLSELRCPAREPDACVNNNFATTSQRPFSIRDAHSIPSAQTQTKAGEKTTTPSLLHNRVGSAVRAADIYAGASAGGVCGYQPPVTCPSPALRDECSRIATVKSNLNVASQSIAHQRQECIVSEDGSGECNNSVRRTESHQGLSVKPGLAQTIEKGTVVNSTTYPDPQEHNVQLQPSSQRRISEVQMPVIPTDDYVSPGAAPAAGTGRSQVVTECTQTISANRSEIRYPTIGIQDTVNTAQGTRELDTCIPRPTGNGRRVSFLVDRESSKSNSVKVVPGSSKADDFAVLSRSSISQERRFSGISSQNAEATFLRAGEPARDMRQYLPGTPRISSNPAGASTPYRADRSRHLETSISSVKLERDVGRDSLPVLLGTQCNSDVVTGAEGQHQHHGKTSISLNIERDVESGNTRGLPGTPCNRDVSAGADKFQNPGTTTISASVGRDTQATDTQLISGTTLHQDVGTRPAESSQHLKETSISLSIERGVEAEGTHPTLSRAPSNRDACAAPGRSGELKSTIISASLERGAQNGDTHLAAPTTTYDHDRPGSSSQHVKRTSVSLEFERDTESRNIPTVPGTPRNRHVCVSAGRPPDLHSTLVSANIERDAQKGDYRQTVPALAHSRDVFTGPGDDSQQPKSSAISLNLERSTEIRDSRSTPAGVPYNSGIPADTNRSTTFSVHLERDVENRSTGAAPAMPHDRLDLPPHVSYQEDRPQPLETTFISAGLEGDVETREIHAPSGTPHNFEPFPNRERHTSVSAEFDRNVATIDSRSSPPHPLHDREPPAAAGDGSRRSGEATISVAFERGQNVKAGRTPLPGTPYNNDIPAGSDAGSQNLKSSAISAGFGRDSSPSPKNLRTNDGIIITEARERPVAAIISAAERSLKTPDAWRNQSGSLGNNDVLHGVARQESSSHSSGSIFIPPDLKHDTAPGGIHSMSPRSPGSRNVAAESGGGGPSRPLSQTAISVSLEQDTTSGGPALASQGVERATSISVARGAETGDNLPNPFEYQGDGEIGSHIDYPRDGNVPAPQPLEITTLSGGSKVDDWVIDGFPTARPGSTPNSAVEQSFTIWRQHFETLRLELLAETPQTHSDTISTIKAELASLKKGEKDEVREVHLLFFFTGLLELLKTLVELDPVNVYKESLHDTLALLVELALHIPSVAFNRPIYRGEGKALETFSSVGLYNRTCSFFGVPPGQIGVEGVPTSRSDIPIITMFEDLIPLTVAYARAIGSTSDQRDRALESFVFSLTLTASLVRILGKNEVTMGWKPPYWLGVVLGTLEQPSPFDSIECVINTVVALGGSTGLRPRLLLDEQSTILKMFNAIFPFLRAETEPDRVRAVHLIWMLETATTHNHVETIIAQFLTSLEPQKVHEAYEAFGVLWRLTDDTLLPGFRFRIPMFIVLDTLMSPDPDLRRISETWMRCNLTSCTQVLEPLLYDLLDPSIQRTPCTVTYNGHEVIGYQYERRFDQHRMNHLLEMIMSLVKFDAQEFGRITRSSSFRNSSHQGFVERVDTIGLVPSDATHTDVLLGILLRFLQSEPQDSSMSEGNVKIQTTAIQIIQMIVGIGGLEGPRLEGIEAAILGKLYWSVHLGRGDLQTKLLAAYNSIVSASSVAVARPKPLRTSSMEASFPGRPEKALAASEMEQQTSSTPFDPLLLQTLIDGTKSTGLPTLQVWLDLILVTMPHIPRSKLPLLCDSVCQQLQNALSGLRSAPDRNSSQSGVIASNTTEAELIKLIKTLEQLVLLSLTVSYDPRQESITDLTMPECNDGRPRSTLEGDTTWVLLSARSPGYRALHDAVRVFYELWVLTRKTSETSGVPETGTSSPIYKRIKDALGILFRAQRSEVTETIITCWYQSSKGESDIAATIELLDTLTSSKITTVHIICDSISYRAPLPDKVVNSELAGEALFGFLEEYLSRLESPLPVEVYNRCILLAKETTSNAHGRIAQIFFTLRCVTVLTDMITETPTTEKDQGIREELQDIFIKLVENPTLTAGRPFMSDKSDLGVISPRLPEPSRDLSEGTASGILTEESTAIDVEVDMSDKINGFLASRVLPNLPRYLSDDVKVRGLCNKLMFAVVTPAMSPGKSRALNVNSSVFEVLQEVSKITPDAPDCRGPVLDTFNNVDFFTSTPETSQKWRPLIRALLDSESDSQIVVPEILSKIPLTESNSDFANRDHEMVLRTLHLRRLSYAVLACEKDKFAAQLPESIQPLLVDILHNPHSSFMANEIYLCLRVLFCRLSPSNLSSLWPEISAALSALLQRLLADPPLDNSPDLDVVLSACKFLDLVMTLQTEEPQIHEWIFSTSTTDATAAVPAWLPEALLDELAEARTDLQSSDNTLEQKSVDTTITLPENDTAPLRRPLLLQVERIGNRRELVSFFSQVRAAWHGGDSTYSRTANIDWTAIEQSLLDEMFEGR